MSTGDLFDALKSAGFEASPVVHVTVGDEPEPPPLTPEAKQLIELAESVPVDPAIGERVRAKLEAQLAAPSKAPPASLFEADEGEPGGPLVPSADAIVEGVAQSLDRVFSDIVHKRAPELREAEELARQLRHGDTGSGPPSSPPGQDLEDMANALRERLSGGKQSGGFSLSFVAKGTPVPMVSISWGRLFDGRPTGQGYESRAVAFATSMREALALAHTYEDIYDAKGKDAAESWLTTQRHRSEGERTMRAVAEGKIPDPVKR